MATTGVSRVQPGRVVADRYEVVRPLGEGGMGLVVLARDLVTGKHVALKGIRGSAEHPDLERLRTEASALAHISSDFVVPLHEVVQDGDTLHLVLPYYPGGNLRTYIRDGERVVGRSLAYAIQICLGMRDACRDVPGLQHRDLKPENVLLGRRRVLGDVLEELDDSEVVAYVADFGLVREAASGRSSAVPMLLGDMRTKTGMLLGTPAYMAPEQHEGAPLLGCTADVFAYGLVVYEMLVGAHAYTLLPPDFSRIPKRGESPLPAVHKVVPQVPRRVSNILLRCTAWDPELRYRDWGHLLADWAEAIVPLEHASDVRRLAWRARRRLPIESYRLFLQWQALFPKALRGHPALRGKSFFSINMRPLAVLKRADLLRAAGKPEEGLAVLETFERLPSDIASARALLGRAVNGSRVGVIEVRGRDVLPLHWKTAMRCLVDAIEARPTDVKRAKAAVLAGVIALLMSEDAEALCLAAQGHMLNGELRPAGDCLDRAERLDPARPHFRGTKACWLERLGGVAFESAQDSDLEGVFDMFEEALTYWPGQHSAVFNQAVVRYRQGRPDEAWLLAERARRMGNSKAQLLLLHLDDERR